MKKILTIIVLSIAIGHAMAQDIIVTKFEKNPMGLRARVDTVADNTGNACALICFDVRDTSIEIEPNLGIVKRETLPGEIRLYVPAGTSRLTIRGEGMLPLRDFRIPVGIESKATYHAIIECYVNGRVETHENLTKPVQIEKPERRTEIEKPKKYETTPKTYETTSTNWFFDAGCQLKNVSGLSLGFGVNANHHVVELSGVLGLDKTDDYYFYNTGTGKLVNTWNYKALKGQLSYGYELCLGDYVGVVPFAGMTVSKYYGTSDHNSSNDYKNASAAAGLADGLRLADTSL